MTRMLPLLTILLIPALGTAQEKRPPRDRVQSSLPDTGRFQIVNGTPDMVRNIMLLDTVTGDVWVSCSGTDGVRGWCPMPKFDGPAVLPARDTEAQR